jgi:hypothetical protein
VGVAGAIARQVFLAETGSAKGEPNREEGARPAEISHENRAGSHPACFLHLTVRDSSLDRDFSPATNEPRHFG